MQCIGRPLPFLRRLLFRLERLAVGAPVHGRVHLVGPHRDAVQRAILLARAVVGALFHRAFDAAVRTTFVHPLHLPFGNVVLVCHAAVKKYAGNITKRPFSARQTAASNSLFWNLIRFKQQSERRSLRANPVSRSHAGFSGPSGPAQKIHTPAGSLWRCTRQRLRRPLYRVRRHAKVPDIGFRPTASARRQKQRAFSRPLRSPSLCADRLAAR